jgi:hypothetical protein
MNHQYINVQTKSYPLYHADIQAHHPGMSLAEDLSHNPPAPFEFVHPSAKPAFNPLLQQLVQGMPVNVNGQWLQKWTVIDIFDNQAARTSAITGDRAAKIENIKRAIKVERDRIRFEGGVNVGHHWYKSDQTATSEYTALALIGATMSPDAVIRPNWRTMDGAAVDMTPALVTQILAAGFTQLAAIDDAAQVHIAAVSASTNPTDYDYSTGWPAHFSS